MVRLQPFLSRNVNHHRGVNIVTSKDAQYGQAWDFKKDVILDDMTLYAKWTGNEYTVTLDKNGGEGGTTSVNVRTGDAMPYAVAPKKSGYSFKGYYEGKDGEGIAYYSDKMKSLKAWDKCDSTTLYANWGIPIWISPIPMPKRMREGHIWRLM